MTEKQFKWYLEKAVKSYNDGKKPNSGKEEEVWKIRDRAYDFMIDDIFKDRMKKKYDELARKCLNEEFCKMTKEEWEDVKKDESKKIELREKVRSMAKDRFYDYLLKE